MIQLTVEIGSSGQRVIREMGRISSVLFRNLNTSFYTIGRNVKEYIQTRMSQTAHAPWFYTKGEVNYHPSLPGEYPAVATGNLYDKIRYKVTAHSMTKYLEVRIGPGERVPYATYLEEGTGKMAPRPFMEPTLVNKESEIIGIIERTVQRTLEF